MIRTVPAAVVQAGTSEVRKVTSLRMNRVAATTLVLVGAIVFSVAGFTVEAALGSQQEDGFSTAGGALTAAVLILAAAIVLAGVFGAIASGSEYRYHTLSVSTLFTPDRNLLFGAKLVVAAVFTLITVLTLEVLGVGAFLLFGRDRIHLEAGFYAMLGGVLLAAVCWSLIGAALGFLLRSPTQAIAVLIGWSILEPLVWITTKAMGFPGFATILPASATVGTSTTGSFEDAPFIAPTPGAIVVLLVWTTGLVAAAWWFLREREL